MIVTCAARRRGFDAVRQRVSVRRRVPAHRARAVQCRNAFVEHRKTCWGERASGRALGAPTANALRMHVSAKRRGCRATPARQEQNTPRGTARQPACETMRDEQSGGVVNGHHVSAPTGPPALTRLP